MSDSVALHLPILATVLLPFAAALLGLGVAHRSVVKDLTVIAGFLALVSAGYRLWTIDGPVVGSGLPVLTAPSGIPPISLGELEIPFHLASGPRTALISFVVALVTLAVLVFATWYLGQDDRLGVFLTTVSLFAAAMQLVVHSGDLILTLIGWEVMGFCSYLLIGHWSRTERARRAAYKSFIVTRLADVGFVLGVVILAVGAGSTNYSTVIAHWIGHPSLALSVAMICLVVAVLGKSAQVPFQDWLADAMAGPTPASALIHAATMVVAGTVVLVQLSLLLSVAPAAQWVLALSVSITMIVGAVLAFGQSDLKTLLAWSTVSQIAVMLAPLAVLTDLGSEASALFHLYAHALFKALLFLTIGWLSFALHSTLADRLRGTARTVLQRAAVVIGLAALAGLPLVVGGWSKELVIATVAGAGTARGLLVLAALLITVVLTAMYATRAALLLLQPSPSRLSRPGRESPTSQGKGSLAKSDLPAGSPRAARRQSDSAPFGARLVIALLTLATLIGGVLLLAFERFLGVEAHVSVLWLLVTLALAVVGGAIAWMLGRSSDPALRLGERQGLWDSGFGVDRLYLAVVATPVLALARAVTTADRTVVDAPVRAIAGQAVRWSERTGDAHTTRPLSAVSLVGVGLIVLLALGVALVLLGVVL